MTSDTVVIQASAIRSLGRSMLESLGAPASSAALVSDHLVDAHIMGLESHGVIRFVQYARDVRSGRIQPAALPNITKSTATLGIVDGEGGFGQVTAIAATDLAVEKARVSGIAAVATRRCNHVGRLGAYAERAARGGAAAFAVAAIPRVGHFVVPSGGRDGRFGTNPIAYAFPTTGDPIVADFATSVIPEGRIRTAKNTGAQLPVGAVLDADGAPTRDPDAFYGPPLGTILPMGGPVGHKGYALAMWVELLGATLLGDRAIDDERSVNGFTIIAVDAGAFSEAGEVRAATDELVKYVTSARPAPGMPPVMVPGQPEFASQRRAGPDPMLTLDITTWEQVAAVAASLDIAVTGGLSPSGLER